MIPGFGLACVAGLSGLGACSETTITKVIGSDTVPTTPALDSIKIRLGMDLEVNIARGGSVGLRVLGFRGKDTLAVPGAQWSTDDPLIATVSASGAVSGLTEGSTVVRVESGSARAQRRVGVWTLGSLYLFNPARRGVESRMLPGDSVQSAWWSAARDAANDFAILIGGTPVRVATSNPGVVSVDSAGLVRAVGVGKAVVTISTPLAVPGQLIDTLTYVVQAPTPMSISVDPHPDTMYTLALSPFSGRAQGMTRYNGPIQSVSAQFVSETGRIVTRNATLTRVDSTTERWSIAAGGDTLSPGRYAVRFTATDEYGRTSAIPDSFSVVVPTVAYDFVTLVDPLTAGYLDPRIYAASGAFAVGVTASYYPGGRPVLFRAGVRELLPTADTGTYRPNAINRAGTVVGTRTWKPDLATTCSQPVVWVGGEVRLIPKSTSCPVGFRGVDINESGQVLLDGPPAILDGATTISVPLGGGVFFLDDSARVLGTVDASGKTPLAWFEPSRGTSAVAGTGDARTVYRPIAIDESGCVLQEENSPADGGGNRVQYTVACRDGRRVLPLDGPAIQLLPNGTVLTANGFLISRTNRVSRITVTGYPSGAGKITRMSDTGVIYVETSWNNGLQGSANSTFFGLGMLVPR